MSAPGLQVARRALAGDRAWVVGGAVRDRLLGRPTADLDLVVEGDPARAARAIARAGERAACFPLSHEFGFWRVVARDGSWQIDVEQLRGATLEEDLTRRDFTVNAIAEPISGGPPIDPLDGQRDLRERRLRTASPAAFTDDPLRVLRLVRVAVELDLQPDRDTLRLAAAQARATTEVAAERVFAELRRIIAATAVLRGITMMDELGLTAVVLPELEALGGVQQNRFHHLDVRGHTLEVLERTVELTGPGEQMSAALGSWLGSEAERVAAVLAEPLADEMTRGEALRWGALLHDAAKPLTRATTADGRVTFIGHDTRGAELAREVLGRLRVSERLRAHVAALVRRHLCLGFLVHEPQPLARRTVFDYLRSCSPVEVDVTLLSVADRLATRGDRATEATAAHLELARGMLGDALRWHAEGPPPPLLRGDQLAAALGIEPGPRLGELLDGLAAARYAGEITTPEQALARARELIAGAT